jgi:hypothetical protein
MPKSELRLAGGEYAPVAARIALFHAKYPDGRVITELVSKTAREVVFKAEVFRTAKDPVAAATGWASERFGDGEVNSVACLENTETSAIGRALANLGFLASVQRPSLEEMEKAQRARNRQVESAGTRSAFPATVRSSKPGASDSARDGNRLLQRRADELSDVLRLLETAGRSGARPERIRSLRSRILRSNLHSSKIERLERRLRHWLTIRTAAPEYES